MDIIPSQPKKRIDRTVIASSKWVTFYKDRIVSNGGYDLEYWCVERSDSVIVLVRQGNVFLLPDMQYRPGIDRQTLDFPGGRIDEKSPEEAALLTVSREFQLERSLLPAPKLITPKPLFVDSAFSDQKVYGFYLELPEKLPVPMAHRYTSEVLLSELGCLQCKAILLEWLRH